MNANHPDRLEGSGRQLPIVVGDSTALTPEMVMASEPVDSFDLKAMWSAIWRNRYLVMSIMAASLVLGALTLFLTAPTYRATASIEINNHPVKVLGTEDFQPISNPQETDRLLQTQIDILRSRALAQRVGSARAVAEHRMGVLAGTLPKLLSTYDISVRFWSEQVNALEKRWWRAIGANPLLRSLAERLGQHWLKGCRRGV